MQVLLALEWGRCWRGRLANESEVPHRDGQGYSKDVPNTAPIGHLQGAQAGFDRWKVPPRLQTGFYVGANEAQKLRNRALRGYGFVAVAPCLECSYTTKYFKFVETVSMQPQFARSEPHRGPGVQRKWLFGRWRNSGLVGAERTNVLKLKVSFHLTQLNALRGR